MPLPSRLRLARRARGFSIVELMVALVVGLLALMFATRLVINGELTKDSSVGASDSMQNGMLALYSLSNDAAQAGWGLNDPLVAGCNTSFFDTAGFTLAASANGAVPTTPLAAVIINANAGAADQISFYTGTSPAGVGSVKTSGAVAAGTTVLPTALPNPYGFSIGDVLVVAPEPATPANPNCSVVQVSGLGSAAAGTANQLFIQAGAATRFNPAGGLANSYAQGGGRIYNLGAGSRLAFHTWSLNNGVLLLRTTDLAGSSAAPVSVIDNIVSIKAQYGFDTVGNGAQVTQWSGTMVDADGDGTVGNPVDYQRVIAVRLAVVARSKTVEKPDLSGQCSATTTQPTVFSTKVPATTAAVPVTVNVAVANDPVDWRCYHYRVFETIVPIRNAQWRP